ncbi:MAG: peptidylprolyl isomerase [Bacteroidota bacterium]
MKKILFTIAVLLLTFNLNINAQVDKPRYQLEIHRAGAFLGMINIELFPSIAPLATANFDSLASAQFFDSTAFHRVVPGFVIQGGDPNSINGPISTWGFGQPWQPTVNAEFSPARHYRGRIGAARDADTNSANSQFYICVANAFNLDGQYTVFGQVTSGLDIVDTIVSSPRNADDVPFQKIEMFITSTGVNDSVPVEPLLTAPLDQAINIPGGVLFQWSNVPDAVIYKLEVSTDSLFGSVNISKRTGVNTSSSAGLLPNTTYHWRVMADNGGHQSGWSSVYTFTTGGPAQLINPPNSSTGVPTNPIFQWTAVPNISSYNLQIDNDTLFTLPFVSNILGLTNTSKQVPNLPSNTQLYWRVRYFSGSISGFYSEKFVFTTGSVVSGVDELYSTGGAYIKNIYPVPAGKSITVEMEAKNNADGSVSIADVTGKITVLNQYFHLSADKLITLDISALKAGIYFITIRTEGMEETRKIEIR